jgi:hypothetical protein
MPDPRNKASRSENGKGASNEGKKYSTGYEDIDHIMQNREGSGSSFELSRGPDLGSETFTWAQPLNDEFKKALEQKLEECRRPGGREKVERDLAKFFRHYGVDACFDIPDYGDTTDSDGEEASPGLVHSPAFPSKVPTKRREAPSSAEPEFSAKKAKQWLESL